MVDTNFPFNTVSYILRQNLNLSIDFNEGQVTFRSTLMLSFEI